MILTIVVLFIAASILSLYSYGKFASSVRGEIGFSLPKQSGQTPLDLYLEPLEQAHPGQTGVLLLNENIDAFLARSLTTREAGRSLDLMYYLWHDDLTSKLLSAEVLKAADRGVKVRMILDDMTAHGRESVLAALSFHPNIEIRLFNPTRTRKNSFRRAVEMLLRLVTVNRRMHNKAWIVDGRVAIVGGRNIGDAYFDASQNTNFYDVDLLLTGEAVAETSAIFDDFWNSAAVIPLTALYQAKPEELAKLREDAINHAKEAKANPYLERLKAHPTLKALYEGHSTQVYWSSNVHVYSDPAAKGLGQEKKQWLIHTLYPTWKQAKTTFKIISPYFVPGKVGTNGLIELRESGTEIEILTNSLAATDVLAVHSGYAPYREPLLKADIQLYELKPFSHTKQKLSLLGSSAASLHTKAFLIDDQIAFVGSFNFDPRSVNYNTEMGVFFEEPNTVTDLLKDFEKRSSPKYSYHLLWNTTEKRLQWLDENCPDDVEQANLNNCSRLWTTEPESGFWKRSSAKFLEWLPIERLL